MTVGFDPVLDVWDPTLGDVYGTDPNGESIVTKEVNISYVLNSFNTSVSRVATISWNDQSNYVLKTTTINWNEYNSLVIANNFRLNWTDRKKVTLQPTRVVWSNYSSAGVKRLATIKWDNLSPRLKTATVKWNERNRVLWARSIDWNDHPKPPTTIVVSSNNILWNSSSPVVHKPVISWNNYANALCKAELRYRIGKTVNANSIFYFNDTVTIPEVELATVIWNDRVNPKIQSNIKWASNQLATRTAKIKYRDELKVDASRTVIFNDTFNVQTPRTIIWDDNQTVIGTQVTMRWSQTNPIINYTDIRIRQEAEINNVEVKSIQGPSA